MINPEVTPEDQKQEEEELEVNMVLNMKFSDFKRLHVTIRNNNLIFGIRNTTKHISYRSLIIFLTSF